MKRGLLKELANTPTAIVCGWRLYGPDLSHLRALIDQPVVIDLLTGDCSVNGSVLERRLFIAGELTRWTQERFQRDGIPEGTVGRATTTLIARKEARTLTIDCSTVVDTTHGTYSSHDIARWGLDDFTG